MRRFFRVFPGLLIASLLATGCVTVDSGQREVKVDDAVTSRVAAGLQYMQQGNPSEARRHFSRALAHNDDSAVAHNAMALLYKYENDPEREEFHYKKALRADRNFAPALNNYGTMLYSRGAYQDALEKFERSANDPLGKPLKKRLDKGNRAKKRARLNRRSSQKKTRDHLKRRRTKKKYLKVMFILRILLRMHLKHT